jgi:dipeptidyl aminopeptidase/acylaminoacyl peptidase
MGVVSGEQRVLQEGSMMASADAIPLPMVPVGWTDAGLFVERILYASDAPPRDLTLVNIESAEATPLREDSHLQVIPSPDGSSVAVIVGVLPIGQQPRAAILLLDIANGDERELVPEQAALIRALRWSPDSAQIAYAAAANYESSETVVGVMNADGSNLQTVEFGVPGFGYRVRDLAWQDSSTPLVLLVNDEGKLELHALPISSFDATGLRPLATFDAEPTGAPPAQILYAPR